MGRDKRNENRTDQFAKWVRSETELLAYKKLSSTAKAAYMHFKIRCRTEGKRLLYNNNGKVTLSARELGVEMGVTARTAGSAIADLQAKGWIVCTQRHKKGVEGNYHSSEWRLTMLPTQKGGKNQHPTFEPKRWHEGNDYEVIEFPDSKKPGHARGDASRFRNSSPNGAKILRYG